MITHQWMRLANFGALEVVVILLVLVLFVTTIPPKHVLLMLKLKYDNLSLKKNCYYLNPLC